MIRQSFDVLWVLTRQNFSTANAREGARLFWLIAEPLGQLTVLIIIFSLVERMPSYGRSFALFMLSGIVNLGLFTRTATLVKKSILDLKRTTRLPAERMFHRAVASALFMFLLTLIYGSLLMIGIAWWDSVPLLPAFPGTLMLGLISSTAMGLGFGLARGYAAFFMPIFERVYVIMTRGLLFISAIFYSPSFMPPQLRVYLEWNPLVHAIELTRMGIYPEYPTIVLDAHYLGRVIVVTLTVAASALWARRVKIMG